MKLAKELVVLFFAALGFYYLTQDLYAWIEPGYVKSGGAYFTSITLTILYGVIKYLQQRSKRDEAKQKEAHS